MVDETDLVLNDFKSCSAMWSPICLALTYRVRNSLCPSSNSLVLYCPALEERRNFGPKFSRMFFCELICLSGLVLIRIFFIQKNSLMKRWLR